LASASNGQLRIAWLISPYQEPVSGLLPVPSLQALQFEMETTNRDDTVGDKILSKPEALELVSQKLETMTTPDEPFVVVDSHTIEKPYGWVFFYNTTRFVETGFLQHTLAGNGPVIVNKYDGTVRFFGSGRPTGDWVAEYERKLAQGNIDSIPPILK
jgi:Immunity protein 35